MGRLSTWIGSASVDSNTPRSRRGDLEPHRTDSVTAVAFRALSTVG